MISSSRKPSLTARLGAAVRKERRSPMIHAGRKTHVYVVDHSQPVRDLIATLVAADRGYEICGMAADAESALQDIDRAQPDIILVELDLPGMDGLAFLDAIRGHWKPMHVIALSRSTQPGTSRCSLAFIHGIKACFDKGKLINNSRELSYLMDEVRADTGLMSVQDPSAATLPRFPGEQRAHPR
jgi:chemotaxis response regulator CheB